MSDSNGSARNVTTPRLGLNKPLVGGDLDVWGDFLNANCDTLDNAFLVGGGVFSGPVGGYPASTPGTPAFSVGSGAGIYAMGASMGVSAFNTQVFSFSLSNNTSTVPLSMNNNRIMSLANPVLGTDAVNLNTVASMGSAYLPVAGGQMLGPINMGGNLLTGLALPQNPADATSKQYVDALIADMRLFVDTWQVAANIPDISNISSITAGDYYIAVTANPTVPETAPSNIPGIAGLLINNGDMVIYSEATAQYELVRGGPLTVAEADALFVNKAGDTMTGGLTVTATNGITVRHPLNQVQGINYDGFGALGANIAFGVQTGILYCFQNGVAVGGLLNLSGGQMTGGIGFSNAVVGTPTDLSRHISLYGSVFGFSITNARLNYNAGGAAGDQHVFLWDGQDIVSIGMSGLTVLTGVLTAPSLTTTGMMMNLAGTLFMDGTGASYLQLQPGGNWAFVANNAVQATIDAGGSVGAYGWLTSRIGLLLNSTAAGELRWSWRMLGDEGGNSTGSDLYMHAFTDDGSPLAALSVTRSTGLAMVIGDPVAPLGIATKQYVDAHSGGGGGGIPEAPQDSIGYVRYNAAWLSGDARYLRTTGGTLTGNLSLLGGIPTLTVGTGTGGGGFGSITFNAAAGAGQAGHFFQIGSVTRWQIRHTLNAAFQLIPYDATGTNLPEAFSFDNATGLGTVAGDPTDPLGIATKQYVDAHGGGGGPFLPLTGGTITGPLTVTQPVTGQSGFAVSQGFGFASAGSGAVFGFAPGWFWSFDTDTGDLEWEAPAGVRLSINGTSGDVAVTNNLTVGSAFAAAGTVSSLNRVYGGGGVFTDPSTTLGFSYAGDADVASAWTLRGSNWTWIWDDVSTELTWFTPNGGLIRIGPAGEFVCVTLIETSDLRTKSEVADYQAGLDDVLRLQPRRFVMDGKLQAGFIAQEVEGILPEAVTVRADPVRPIIPADAGKRPPPREDHLSDRRYMTHNPITAALVNAMKEIDARLRAIEGGRYVQ